MGGFRSGIDIDGRPDLNCNLPEEEQFWKRKVKANLPYVPSTSRNACLIHKVAYVEARWYSGHYSYMRRLEQPWIHAQTVCGLGIYLSNGKKSGKMCGLPDPNAVLCGRCHGELPTFSKHRTARIKKQWAKDHLGCKGVVEVIGPYQHLGGDSDQGTENDHSPVRDAESNRKVSDS